MKRTVYFFSITVHFMGCVNLQKPIFSDASNQEIDHNYKTYHIIQNAQLPEKLAYSIESVINVKLDALGYQKSKEEPDLIINYQIYKDNFSTSALVVQGVENASSKKQTELRTIKFKHGSIYITFFNKESKEVVWRGFSDGFSMNPRIVKAKSYEIMSHYNVIAPTETLVTVR